MNKCVNFDDCGNEAIISGVCQPCHDDGWRGGAEMIQALRDDPKFTVSDDGQIGLAGVVQGKEELK